MIRAKIISEVVGSPQNHVDDTLKLLLDKIKERKDFVVNNEQIFEAQKMENNPLFSGFIEYELELSDVKKVIDFCFDFMPSSIEIIEPDEFNINSFIISDLFNELMARLHQNELTLRNALAQIELLKKSNGK